MIRTLVILSLLLAAAWGFCIGYACGYRSANTELQSK
jgi:hypothetical protein